MFKKAIFGLILSLALGSGYLIGIHQNKDVVAQKKDNSDAKIFELFKQIKSSGIRDYVFFEADGKQFLAVVQTVDEPPTVGSMFKKSDKLRVFDRNGEVVYEQKDVSISGLRLERLQRSDTSELLFSSNGGGTDWFLTILSFRKGRFVELADPSEFQYRGGYFTIPAYRTGNSAPYFKPSQLIVIHQSGGADDNPSASVFRTESNKFQKIGEIKMQELGDFIEKSLASSKK